MEKKSIFTEIPEESGWPKALHKSLGFTNRRIMGRTKLHDSARQAIYHGDILGEVSGCYDVDNITKPDGSLRPYSYKEATEEDRKRVSEIFDKLNQNRNR